MYKQSGSQSVSQLQSHGRHSGSDPIGRHRCAEDPCVLELKCRTVAIITELKGGMPVALPMCWRPMSLGVDEFSSWPSDETHRWPKDKIDDGPVAIVVSLPSRRRKSSGF